MPRAALLCSVAVALFAVHARGEAGGRNECESVDAALGPRFSAAGRSGLPSLAADDTGIVVVWTEDPGDKRVRAERFDLLGRARASPSDTTAPLVVRNRARSTNEWLQGAAATSHDAVVAYLDDGALWTASVAIAPGRWPDAPRRLVPAGVGAFREIVVAGTGNGDTAIAWADGYPDVPVRLLVARHGALACPVPPRGTRVIKCIEGTHDIVIHDRAPPVDPKASPAADARGIDVDDVISVGVGWIPDVAMSPTGDRVVVAWTAHEPTWLHGAPGAPLPQVEWRAFDGAGVPLGEAQPVALGGPRVEEFNARTAVAPDGRFVVGWNTLRDRTKKGARVRLFDRDGAPLGPPIDVDDESGDRPDAGPTGAQHPRDRVAADLEDITMARAPGGFAVSWLRERGGGGGDVVVRWFDWDGHPRTRPLVVGEGALRFHQLAVTDDGHEVIVWADASHVLRGVVSPRCEP